MTITQLPEIALEVGMFYIDRQWGLIEIVEKSTFSFTKEATSSEEEVRPGPIFKGNTGRFYTVQGWDIFSEGKDFDILKLVDSQDAHVILAKFPRFVPQTVVNERSYAKAGEYTPHTIVKFEVEAILDMVPGMMHQPEDHMAIICQNPYVRSVTLTARENTGPTRAVKAYLDSQTKVD